MPQAEEQDDDGQGVQSARDHGRLDEPHQQRRDHAVVNEEGQEYARHDKPVVSTVERASVARRSGGEVGNAEPSPPPIMYAAPSPALSTDVILRWLEGETDRTWPDEVTAIGVGPTGRTVGPASTLWP